MICTAIDSKKFAQVCLENGIYVIDHDCFIHSVKAINILQLIDLSEICCVRIKNFETFTPEDIRSIINAFKVNTTFKITNGTETTIESIRKGLTVYFETVERNARSNLFDDAFKKYLTDSSSVQRRVVQIALYNTILSDPSLLPDDFKTKEYTAQKGEKYIYLSKFLDKC